MDDKSVILLLSTPFLLIFVTGCYIMYVTFMIDDELEERKKDKQQAI